MSLDDGAVCFYIECEFAVEVYVESAQDRTVPPGFDEKGRQIVPTYRLDPDTGAMIVPNAIDDIYGGRPDLNANTRVEILTIGAMTEAGKPAAKPAATRAQVMDIRTTQSAAQPKGIAVPLPLPNSSPPVVQPAILPPAPAAVAELVGTVTGYSGKPYIARFAGPFGTYKFYPADAIERDKFFVLVFTAARGDAELAFEPPIGVSFDLCFEMTDGSLTRTSVQHVGLMFSLPVFNASIVLLVKTAEQPA